MLQFQQKIFAHSTLDKEQIQLYNNQKFEQQINNSIKYEKYK